MHTPVSLRGLRPADVPHLEELVASQLGRSYPGGAHWLRTSLHAGTEARDPDRDITVAVREDGHVVGLLAAHRKPRGVKLSCLWVADTVRGHGIGRALLNRAVTAFGTRELYVTFDESHLPAMAPLLAPAGFQQVAQLPGRYRPGAVEVVYRRRPDTLDQVRALSLTRPWGQLLMDGGKNIENRSRRTSHRGLLVLHGAQSRTDLADSFCPARDLPLPPAAADCPTGYLGVAHLVGVDCHHDECGDTCSPWAMPSSWHWRVAFAVQFPEPIPGRGNVSLWTPPDEVLAAVRTVLATA